MEPMDWITQGIGVAAMVFGGLSYQRKSRRGILLFQMVAAILFAVHYLMLGSIVGGLLNALAVARALVYGYPEKTKAQSLWWVTGFTAGYLAAYVLSFAVFSKEPTAANLIIELLPVLAMTVATVSFRLSASMVRRLGLIVSPLWLIYNVIGVSIGGICAEIINLVSILLGIWRLDRKKN